MMAIKTWYFEYKHGLTYSLLIISFRHVLVLLTLRPLPSGSTLPSTVEDKVRSAITVWRKHKVSGGHNMKKHLNPTSARAVGCRWWQRLRYFPFRSWRVGPQV